MRRLQAAFSVALTVLTWATPVGAQTTTGTITGRVVDGQGLSVPGVTVTVEGSAIQAVQTAIFKQELIATLPTTRDLHATLLMAPAVHPSGPSGNYSIAGAMSFESLFMVNGVTANENIRGQG